MNTGYLICIHTVYTHTRISFTKVQYTELYNNFQRELFSKTRSCLHSNTMFYNTRIKLSETKKKKKKKFAQAQTGHKVHILYAQLEATVRGIQRMGHNSAACIPTQKWKNDYCLFVTTWHVVCRQHAQGQHQPLPFSLRQIYLWLSPTTGIQVEALQQ